MDNKPRYRYDWKSGRWLPWHLITGSGRAQPPKGVLSTKREPGRYMSDAESLELVEAMLRKRVLQ